MARPEQYFKIRLKRYGRWLVFSKEFDNYDLAAEKGQYFVKNLGYEDYEIIKI